ncbi:MAG: endonuclease III [bacterium]|nr:endonuclease III [bacterium]
MSNLDLKKKRAEVVVRTLKELFPHPKPALHYSNPWEFLVAVILSAQCTDKRVNIVTKDLFEKYKSIEDYMNASQSEFEQDVRSTGFFRNKTKNILATAKIIHTEYKDDLPRTMEQMLALPGVARKTANVVLGNAFGLVFGIAVDTHVIRLSQLYGLTSEKTPEKIEKDLMELVPKNEWTHFSLRLAEYGRQYCPAKKHDHDHCPLHVALAESKIAP